MRTLHTSYFMYLSLVRKLLYSGCRCFCFNVIDEHFILIWPIIISFEHLHILFIGPFTACIRVCLLLKTSEQPLDVCNLYGLYGCLLDNHTTSPFFYYNLKLIWLATRLLVSCKCTSLLSTYALYRPLIETPMSHWE